MIWGGHRCQCVRVLVGIQAADREREWNTFSPPPHRPLVATPADSQRRRV